ncbi:FkbM family methyltransferase [Psychromonas sp. KJ10-10]|uniref:FkbM family methyltransferase n=1 Tax=Psychromonas sp. KJ10-10 TaxID=3391823 RepID=UPI0039B4E3BE
MIDLFELISSWSLKDHHKLKIIKSIFDKNETIRCYALGINEHSITLSKEIPIAGYIDDFTNDSILDGLPIFKMQDISSQTNSVIVNCILCTKPSTALNRALEQGCSNIINLTDLLKFNANLTIPDFVKEMRNDFVNSNKKWRNVYEHLEDEESKKVFNDLISYRLTADISYLNNYSFRPLEQYFEPFMDYNDEVFVDAGGFTGDTTEQFCKRYPNYKKVYLIEPSIKNMQQAKDRLINYSNITYISKGVSNKVEQLNFSSNSGSASSVCENGNVVIDVAPIDLLINETVSFIKMDLEGWEINALEGARKHIFLDHPKLAIVAYHKADDFWKIYDFIMGIRNDYKVFIRHYTEGWSETVMYFLPIR